MIPPQAGTEGHGDLAGLTKPSVYLPDSTRSLQLRTPVAPAEAPSAGQELLNFLVYYGRTFDVWNKTISTANGGELLDKGMRFPKARAERLSIVHPIEPERDLASGSYEFSQVSMAMWQAAQDLVKYPTLWGCDARTSALSLAGFRLSHAVIEQRALNQRLEADGTLARRAESWQTHMPMDYDTVSLSRLFLTFAFSRLIHLVSPSGLWQTRASGPYLAPVASELRSLAASVSVQHRLPTRFAIGFNPEESSTGPCGPFLVFRLERSLDHRAVLRSLECRRADVLEGVNQADVCFLRLAFVAVASGSIVGLRRAAHDFAET